ncbi:MAG: GNAT family N-acetyltransferase [Parabacteroides sp.]|nr:GNAT family N-acetyltransferase [Parabacteroides sp.]
MLLSNDRVRLRALEPEDLELLYRWENDPELWEVGDTLAPYSRYILKECIEGSHLSIYESHQLRLMIEECATGITVGIVDLFDFEPRPNRAACGIMLDRRYQGHGFATEALRLLMEYAYSFLKIHQLYVHIPVANEPSKRLFARLGFVETGTLKDWIKIAKGYSDVCVMQSI